MDILDLALAYGYLGLFLALFLEYLGVPGLPGEAFLLLAGSFAASGRFQLVPALVAGVAGSMLGYTLAYFIGRAVGLERLKQWGRYVWIKEQHWTHGERFWKRYSLLLLLGSRYVTGIRHVTPYLAGVTRMPVGRFLVWNTAGSVLWVIPLVLAGRTLGDNWKVVESWFHSIWVLGAAGFLVVVGATVWILARRARRRKQGH